MKPLQIGLLVVAGALGGALVMKWQSTRHTEAPVVAEAPAAASVPASAATPAEAVAPAEQVPEPPPPAAAPSPVPEKNKPARKPSPAKKPAPAVIAQNDGPARPPVTSKPPEPDPAPQAAPNPAPPARPAPQPVQEPMREAAPQPAPAAPNQVTLPANLVIPIRLMDGLSTERNVSGDAFTATLDAPLVADGFVIAERGARVEGKVVESVKAGKVSGVSSLAVVLTRVRLSDGQNLAVETQTFTKKGPTSHGEDAAKVGGGAGLGAIIGAIAGGGRGAGIGAAVGGAAGAGDVLLTRGKPATLPSETRINFRLASAVTVTERR